MHGGEFGAGSCRVFNSQADISLQACFLLSPDKILSMLTSSQDQWGNKDNTPSNDSAGTSSVPALLPAPAASHQGRGSKSKTGSTLDYLKIFSAIDQFFCFYADHERVPRILRFWDDHILDGFPGRTTGDNAVQERPTHSADRAFLAVFAQPICSSVPTPSTTPASGLSHQPSCLTVDPLPVQASLGSAYAPPTLSSASQPSLTQRDHRLLVSAGRVPSTSSGRVPSAISAELPPLHMACDADLSGSFDTLTLSESNPALAAPAAAQAFNPATSLVTLHSAPPEPEVSDPALVAAVPCPNAAPAKPKPQRHGKGKAKDTQPEGNAGGEAAEENTPLTIGRPRRAVAHKTYN